MIRCLFITFVPTGTGAERHRLKDPANTVAGQRVSANRHPVLTRARRTTAAVTASAHARAGMESLRVAIARLVLSTMARRAAKTIISNLSRATTIRRTATATMTAPLWSATALLNIISQRTSVASCILLALSCQQIVRPRTTTRTTGLRTAGFSESGASRPRGSLLSLPMARCLFITFVPTGTGAERHRLKDPAYTVAGQRVSANTRHPVKHPVPIWVLEVMGRHSFLIFSE